MTISRADIFLLEYKIRQLAPRMNVSLTAFKGAIHNTPYDYPVLFKWGSNGFYVERESLNELMPLVEDEASTAYCWLSEYVAPFIRCYAS